MQQEYQKILSGARSKHAQWKKLGDQLSRKKEQDGVDEAFGEAHEKAFEKIDCLSCANCCKTTGPLWTPKDTERVARFLQMKPSAFVEKYLRRDEDGDDVLKTVPCVFLDPADNYCRIYDVRPEACRDYPHTHRSRMKKIMDITLENIKICPAVALIFEDIQTRINTIR